MVQNRLYLRDIDPTRDLSELVAPEAVLGTTVFKAGETGRWTACHAVSMFDEISEATEWSEITAVRDVAFAQALSLTDRCNSSNGFQVTTTVFERITGVWHTSHCFRLGDAPVLICGDPVSDAMLVVRLEVQLAQEAATNAA